MRHKEIGERIKQRRKEIGISAADLSERLQMSKATIHRYESGEIKTIKLPVIEVISKELKCNPAWIIGKSNRKEIIEKVDLDNRYRDVSNTFDDMIVFLERTDNITCYGKRLVVADKNSIIIGLSTIRDMVCSKYK